MSDWQAGDLAVCVDAHDNPAFRPTEVREGRTYRVTQVINHPFRNHAGWPGLLLQGIQCDCTNGFDHRRFRKIRPDEQEACEPEFVTLLKRSKRKVSA
jgi:hypothetical protein